ncbi:hypothetical protein AXF42_Ash010349 [Apostasia shenzhenica]|uniref:Uncharacterized protein n=1 Tax=Apostasia shenzhenica TaxID=1088818 RepID=A0A2I0BDR8_9ASPA|nr:hypothetical protein AXF42_Ash010349 [Apostasia shenzhenica]
MEVWWDRMIFSMKRFWIRMAARLGLPKTGLGRLRQEVRTCEYEDVHVMWEMLRRTDTKIGMYPPLDHRRQPKRRDWAIHNLCNSF